MRSGRPEHLFARWGLVRRRLSQTKHLALLFDFDGTLVPIQARPTQARLSKGTRRLLARLARQPRTTVCLISGRRLADLRRRARVPGAEFLGLHGWEGNPSADGLPRRVYRMIRRLKRTMTPQLRAMRGVELEDKGFALGVHYRRATAGTRARAGGVLRKALASADGCLRIVHGKKVWEVLPCENQGKGAAIRQLARQWPASTMAFYFGDDASDEPAFRTLSDSGRTQASAGRNSSPRAITVLVGGRRRTAARYWLREPEEVRAFLRRLDSEIR